MDMSTYARYLGTSAITLMWSTDRSCPKLLVKLEMRIPEWAAEATTRNHSDIDFPVSGFSQVSTAATVWNLPSCLQYAQDT